MSVDQVWQRLEVVYCKGSLLGLLLFAICIDDVDEEVFDEISKFVDETQIVSQVNTMINAKDSR